MTKKIIEAKAAPAAPTKAAPSTPTVHSASHNDLTNPEWIAAKAGFKIGALIYEKGTDDKIQN